jgi:probable blue pigment (indigoidine) exporter
MLVPLALAVEGRPSALTLPQVGGYTYLAVIGAVVAYLIWFRGIERLGATVATFLTLVSPAVATLLGALVSGERFTLVQAIGIVVVLASIVIGASSPAATTNSTPSAPVQDRPAPARQGDVVHLDGGTKGTVPDGAVVLR